MMKLILGLAIITGAFVCNAQDSLSQASPGKVLQWHTTVAEAYDLSKTSGKPIFAFFTGSDWCGWCHKLQHDVFSKPSFITWANESVVLLELDFPRRKQLSPELAQQNNELQQVFRVGSYPTIWMFFLNRDEVAKKINITALGSLGYPPGAEEGKEEVSFITNANRIITNGKKTTPP
jgi:thiol-disulfide isomerase/thioredoxin